jgi:membrane protein insertase Oxa1/YidC/SpoIIIJ
LKAADETAGGPMTEVVLIGIVVLIFFTVGFAVGIGIAWVIGRWGSGGERRDDCRRDVGHD